MLQPKRMKFRKMHKGRNRGYATGDSVSFGTYGLKSVGRGRMTARQIEAARRAMTRAVKRQGKIWIRVFPDKPITEKPLEVRQGQVTVTLNTGFAKFNLVVCSTNWQVFQKN